MPTVADRIPGLAPKREAKKLDDGSWVVTVTPPAFMDCKGASVILTAQQYMRYDVWLNKGGMIQELLSDLSTSEREVLMSGLTDEDLRKMDGDDA